MEFAPPGEQYALQGLGSGTVRIGTILGPFVGGYLTRFVSFPAAFFVGGALALSDFILATRIEHMADPYGSGGSLPTHLVEYHQ